MIRRTPFKRSTKPLPRTRVRSANPKRKAREWARTYHSKEYVQWIHTLPCAACGVVGYSEVAHIKTGGTGRKADWTDTVPLCGPIASVLEGCHSQLHLIGRNTFELDWDIDLEVAAAYVQESWRAYTEEGK